MGFRKINPLYRVYKTYAENYRDYMKANRTFVNFIWDKMFFRGTNN
jgi:hypothetical protein